MRRISPTKKKHNELYKQSKQELTAQLIEHQNLHAGDVPLCERCNSRKGTEFHHKAGRAGSLLWHKPHLCWLCRDCHVNEVHAHPAEARLAGWLVDLTQEQRNNIRAEELPRLYES